MKEITAMCLSSNKRFLAVCEKHRNDPNAYVSFYDMKNNAFKQIKSSINLTEHMMGAASASGAGAVGTSMS